MKFLFTLLLILILSFTPNCQNTKNTSFLSVPGGGENGLWKVYTLYMLLSFSDRIPSQCPTIIGSIQPNIPTILFKKSFYSINEINTNDLMIIKNINPSESSDTIVVGFYTCSPNFDGALIYCNKGFTVKPGEEVLCTPEKKYSNLLIRISFTNVSYDPLPNSSNFIIEVKKNE